MGADKGFLNGEGLWYVGETPIQVAHLKQRVATVMPGQKKKSTAKRAIDRRR